MYLLFDLDRTLWNFEGNADITFGKMYQSFQLEELTHVDCHTFHEYYRIVNDQLWEAYRNGTIAKEILNIKRFTIPLEHFGVTENVGNLSVQLGEFYVHEGPKQTGLMPGARELLEYLSTKPQYTLCIITNGFKEAQIPKMHSSNIHHYFKHFFLSEELGFMKPKPQFFEEVLHRLSNIEERSLTAEECMVIGDDYNVDIIGAINSGIPQIFYNYNGKYTQPLPQIPTHTVQQLKEIIDIL